MIVGKYRYYFKKPRSEIAKDILKSLLVGGAIVMAANSPYFVVNLLVSRKRFNKYPKHKISDTFYKFKQQGLIDIRRENRQIYISLTEEGKKKAGWLQIDDLKIVKPKKWDRKWRLVMFDIAEMKKLSREAFRGKLKEMGFCPFQKSIWIHPFDCEAEIGLLRKFFNLSEKELKLITATNIGTAGEWENLFGL